jgi:hypothetical protein
MKTPLIAAVSGTLISLLATGAQAATYAIDPTHTFVVFEIDHFGTASTRRKARSRLTALPRPARSKSPSTRHPSTPAPRRSTST